MKRIVSKPIETDKLATRIVPMVQYTGGTSSYFRVYATNNANDTNPEWEDITECVKNKTGYTYKNTILTALKGAVSLMICLDYSDSVNFDSNSLDFDENYVILDFKKVTVEYEKNYESNFSEDSNGEYITNIDLSKGVWEVTES